MPHFRTLGALLLVCTGAVAQTHPPTRPPITGIAFVSLYEPDLDATRHFYEDFLGWPEATSMQDPAGTRFMVNPMQWVEIRPLPAIPPGYYLEHIAFATSNAEQLLRYMRAKGVNVPATLSKHRDGSRFFKVDDPEGNNIEFIETTPIVMPPTPVAPLSHRIIHAGLAVRDGAKEDRFYKDVLQFRLYWHSLPHDDGRIDFVSMQVPEGTDWLEYMQNNPEDRSIKRLSTADHFSPGVVSVEDSEKVLEARGVKAPQRTPKRRGNDGKWQLNLRDPSGTRIELMEFAPTSAPTVPFTGPHPAP